MRAAPGAEVEKAIGLCHLAPLEHLAQEELEALVPDAADPASQARVTPPRARVFGHLQRAWIRDGLEPQPRDPCSARARDRLRDQSGLRPLHRPSMPSRVVAYPTRGSSCQTPHRRVIARGVWSSRSPPGPVVEEHCT